MIGSRRAVAAAAILLTCAADAVVACHDGAERPVTGIAAATPTATSGTPITTGGSPGAACPAPAFDPVDAGSVLVPGPINGLPRSDAGGEKLVIAAVVLDPACTPASGASVKVWHTDARGLYGPAAGAEACCYFGGTVRSDGNGRFQLDTIRPAQYPKPSAPPAHIHMEINHSAGRLTPKIIFSGSDPRAQGSGIVAVPLRKVDDHWYGEAVLVLAQ